MLYSCNIKQWLGCDWDGHQHFWQQPVTKPIYFDKPFQQQNHQHLLLLLLYFKTNLICAGACVIFYLHGMSGQMVRAQEAMLAHDLIGKLIGTNILRVWCLLSPPTSSASPPPSCWWSTSTMPWWPSPVFSPALTTTGAAGQVFVTVALICVLCLLLLLVKYLS